MAARRNARVVEMGTSKGQDKVFMGRAQVHGHARGKRRNTAYHEAGHAI